MIISYQLDPTRQCIFESGSEAMGRGECACTGMAMQLDASTPILNPEMWE